MRLALVVMLFGLMLFTAFALFAYSQARRNVQNGQERNLSALATRVAADLDSRITLHQSVLANAALTMPAPGKADPMLEERLRLLRPVFDGIALYGPDAVERAASANVPLGLSLYGKHCLLDPSAHRRARVLTFPGTAVFCAPMLGLDGAYRGMLAATIDLDSPSMRHGLESVRMIGHGVSILVYASDSRRQALRFGDDTPPLSALTYDKIMRHPATGGSGGVDGDEGALRVVYTPLESINWVVAAIQPADESAHILARMRRNLFLAALLWVCLTPLQWHLIGFLLRPLRRLRQQLLEFRPGFILHSDCRDVQSLAMAANQALRRLHDTIENLEQRESYLRRLCEGTPAAVFVVDADASIEYLNPAMLSLLGTTIASHWLGRPWLDLICSEDREELEQRWAGRQAGAVFVAAGRLQHEHRLYAQVELRLLPSGSGFLGFAHDVSESASMRLALLAEQERSMAIVAAVSDAIIFTSHKGEIGYMNRSAEILLGIAACETMGRPLAGFAAFAMPDTGLALSNAQLEALAGRLDVELDLVGRNARLQPVLLTLSVLSPAPGKVEGRVYVLRDDSERRERERVHRRDAGHDPLTRLYNRHGFMAAYATVAGDGGGHVLAVLGIDNFESMLGSMGQQGGDRMLERVAAAIQSRIRRTDVAARLVGGEFAILLLCCETEWAQALLEDVRRCVQASVADAEPAIWPPVTVSIGMIRLVADDHDPDEALARAAAHCQRAKSSGGNCLLAPDETVDGPPSATPFSG